MIEDKATLHNEFIGYLDGRAIDSALEYASRLALTGIANGPRTSRANRYYGILGERDSLYIRDERGTRAFILEDARWRPASPSVLIRDIAVLIESGAPVWSADDEDFHINDLTYAAERHAETRLFDARRRRPRIHALATPFVHALHRDAALFQRAGDTHTATWLLRTVLPTLSGLRTPQHAPLILNLLRQYSTPPETHAGWTTLYHQISSVDDFHDTASAHAESLRRDVNTRRPYFIAVIYSQIPPYRHPRVS